MSKMEISRRDFLKGAAAGAASLAVMGLGNGVALAEDAPEVMNADLSLKKWDFEIPPAPIPRRRSPKSLRTISSSSAPACRV